MVRAVSDVRGSSLGADGLCIKRSRQGGGRALPKSHRPENNFGSDKFHWPGPTFHMSSSTDGPFRRMLRAQEGLKPEALHASQPRTCPGTRSGRDVGPDLTLLPEGLSPTKRRHASPIIVQGLDPWRSSQPSIPSMRLRSAADSPCLKDSGRSPGLSPRALFARDP